MPKQVIVSSNAPKAIGPYSQGIRKNGFIFVSGQLPVDPETSQMPEDIQEQAKVSLQNVVSVLREAGASVDDVVKVTVYLKDLSHFGAVNEVYATVFKNDCPARCCVEVARLPRDAGIEIDAIAVVD